MTELVARVRGIARGAVRPWGRPVAWWRALAASLDRPLPRRIVRALGAVTGNGWAVVLACAVAALLVWRAGWLEAGVVLGVGVISLLIGALSTLGGSGYAVEVALPHTRTVAGQTVLGELRVRNTRQRALRPGIVELPVGPSAPPFVVPRLAPGETWAEPFAVPTHRRGVIVLGPARSVRGDALGLFRRIRPWNEPVRLIVHPRTIRVPFDATGFQSDVEGVATARLSSSDVSFHALRDYAPGDDRRHVHWPTTARTGRLTVRQFEETRRSHHLILLDTDRASWPDPDDFETAVSVAASLAVAGLSRNRRVSVATSSGWLSTTSPGRLLDACAEVGPVAGPPSVLQRVRECVAARPATSVLTVVCGPGTPDDTIVRWPQAAGVDVTTGVVRVHTSGSAVRRSVGRSAVAECPSLEDLPRLVGAAGRW